MSSGRMNMFLIWFSVYKESLIFYCAIFTFSPFCQFQLLLYFFLFWRHFHCTQSNSDNVNWKILILSHRLSHSMSYKNTACIHTNNSGLQKWKSLKALRRRRYIFPFATQGRPMPAYKPNWNKICKNFAPNFFFYFILLLY
jgi:hypothetical protein